MVIIDTGMPESCEHCKAICSRFNENEKSMEHFCGITGAFITNYFEDLKKRDMKYCPIKCDIEDIKAEIQYEADNNADVNSMRAYYHCLQIIDKYTHNETQANITAFFGMPF